MVPSRDALQRFLASTTTFLRLLDGLRDEEWRLRPTGEEWSLAETVEHVVTTNQTTLRRLQKEPASPSLQHATPRISDDAIREEMFHGVPPPPGLPEPTGSLAAVPDGVAALEGVRDAIAERARALADGLRALVLPHPVFGLMDGVQWVLFLAAHTDNHVPQIRRLRERLARADAVA